jgi:hypothetical protein
MKDLIAESDFGAAASFASVTTVAGVAGLVGCAWSTTFGADEMSVSEEVVDMIDVCYVVFRMIVYYY